MGVKKHIFWLIPIEKFKEACEKSKTIIGIASFLGLKGAKNSLRQMFLKRIEEEEVDISHMKRGLDWNKGSSLKKPNRISVKHFKEVKTGFFECTDCSLIFSKQGICSHYLLMHGELKDFRPLRKKRGPTNTCWNKGLTKENHPSLVKQGETHKQRIKEGKVIPHQKGKPLSSEQKAKISKNMKKAHAEGRAWNIGKSRWNNEPSYPEQFFQKVIENEFEDKNYKREFPLSIYSLDFAWEHKKRCIEIDGQQHERFQEYKDRDERKDKAIADAGWAVLRIPWVEMFHNPKHWIKVAREFINS